MVSFWNIITFAVDMSLTNEAFSCHECPFWAKLISINSPYMMWSFAVQCSIDWMSPELRYIQPNCWLSATKYKCHSEFFAYRITIPYCAVFLLIVSNSAKLSTITNHRIQYIYICASGFHQKFNRSQNNSTVAMFEKMSKVRHTRLFRGIHQNLAINQCRLDTFDFYNSLK